MFLQFTAVLIDQRVISNLCLTWGQIYPPVPIKSIQWHDLWTWMHLTGTGAAAAVSSASVLLLHTQNHLIIMRFFTVMLETFFKLKAQKPMLRLNVWWRRTWDPSCPTSALRSAVSPVFCLVFIKCIKILKSVVKNLLAPNVFLFW